MDLCGTPLPVCMSTSQNVLPLYSIRETFTRPSDLAAGSDTSLGRWSDTSSGSKKLPKRTVFTSYSTGSDGPGLAGGGFAAGGGIVRPVTKCPSAQPDP